MKTAITISIATALSMAPMVPVSAQPARTAPAVIPVSSSSVGPWIVGGIGLGVLSVMARAAVVGTREDRELTSPEATQAFFLPFIWVVSLSVPAGQPDPERLSSSNDWLSPKDSSGKPTLKTRRRKVKPNLG